LARKALQRGKQTCLQPDSGVYSIETSEARPPPTHEEAKQFVFDLDGSCGPDVLRRRRMER